LEKAKANYQKNLQQRVAKLNQKYYQPETQYGTPFLPSNRTQPVSKLSWGRPKTVSNQSVDPS
jgi:hypothetical protein